MGQRQYLARRLGVAARGLGFKGVEVTSSDPLADADALWVVHHDYAGLARAKSIPPERFDEVLHDGVSYGLAVWDYTFDGEHVPGPGFGLQSGDFVVRPDITTLLRLPHLEGVAQVHGDLSRGGQPWDGDPRARLRSAVAELAASGYRARVALEVEFLVLRADPGSALAPVERGPMYGSAALEGQWHGWIHPMLVALEAASVGVHQFAREGSPGQFELSLLPSDALSACDRYLVARQIIKGSVPAPLAATFMPKPFADLAGNGLHVHISLETDDGTPVLPDPNDHAALSPLGRSVVAGLVRRAAAQCAIGSPTPNSFERFVRGSGAPTHATWSFGNRSALVRIPGPGAARRIEYRTGDASANVYLHLTGLLATITDALRQETGDVPRLDVDLATLSDAEVEALPADALPVSLDAALDALEADAVIAGALGPTLMGSYVALKRYEHARRQDTLGPGDRLAWDRAMYLHAL